MRLLGWTLLTLFATQNAFAVLGEKPEAATAVVKAAAKHSAQLVPYMDHLQNSIAVREYIHTDGTVFAVKWQGHGHPSRETLLGRYYGEYRIATAMPTTRIPRRALSASSDNLTIVQFGHPGDLHGFVALKNHVPSGLTLEDLP